MTTILRSESFRAPEDSSWQNLESRPVDELRTHATESGAGPTLDIARHPTE